MRHNTFITRALTGVVFAAIVAGATLLSLWSFVALLFVIAVGCIRELRRLTSCAQWIVLSLLYVVLPLVLLLAITIGPAFSFCEGMRWIEKACIPLFLMAMVWANDIFAYLVGSAFGRHKMAPHVSPKKSWEGFAGGIAATIGMGILAAHLLENPWLWGAELGLATGLGAVGGDLFESWLKRRAGVKDSGRVMPGHGGFLDRFDALLGAVPCAMVYLILTELLW